MDIIYAQSVTSETVPSVRKRYSSLGWGEVYLKGTGSCVTELYFKWCREGSPALPDISDLGLKSPRRL